MNKVNLPKTAAIDGICRRQNGSRCCRISRQSTMKHQWLQDKYDEAIRVKPRREVDISTSGIISSQRTDKGSKQPSFVSHKTYQRNPNNNNKNKVNMAVDVPSNLPSSIKAVLQ